MFGSAFYIFGARIPGYFRIGACAATGSFFVRPMFGALGAGERIGGVGSRRAELSTDPSVALHYICSSGLIEGATPVMAASRG
jgi:hypothetical protein